jgi:uncharacterized protein
MGDVRGPIRPTPLRCQPVLRDLRDMDRMQRAEHYAFEFAGGRFLLNVHTSMCYQVEPVTLEVLGALTGGAKVTQIIRRLSSRFPRADVIRSLSLLLDGGFFFEEPPQAPPLVAPQYDENVKIGGTNINVTHRCNLRCTYCYGDSDIYPAGIGPRHWGPESTMSLATARRVVDFLVREGSREVHLSFFGGEPLLNFPAMREIADYARRATARYGVALGVGLFTNGTLIDEDVVAFLNEHRSGVTISVDGPPEAHDKNRPDAHGRGTWQRIMDNMALLRERLHAPAVEFRGSYTKTQVQDGISLLDYIRVAQEQGAQTLWAVPIVQVGCRTSLTEEDIPVVRREYERAAQYLVEQFNKTGTMPAFRNIVDRMRKTRFVAERPEFNECGAARGFVCPAPDGSVYACHQLTGMDEWRMGHVFGDFSRCKTFEVCQNARVSQTCPDCGLRYFCGLGCLKNKINATGHPYTPDRSVECAVMKAELEAAFYVNAHLPWVLDSRTFQHIWGPHSDLYRRILSVC